MGVLRDVTQNTAADVPTDAAGGGKGPDTDDVVPGPETGGRPAAGPCRTEAGVTPARDRRAARGARV
jgi:hypothetical protein